MAGTGNLLLKRGQTVPTDGALLRAMPAVQLIAPSPVVGTQAYVNYPNRLWVGMDDDGTLVPNQNNCTTGNFSYSNAEANSGTVGAIPGVIGPCNGTGATINNTRPIWMGAEIRAAVAVDDVNNTGTPTILEADWAHPSDYILVTQKSIYDWANAAFAKGSGGGTVKLFENSDPTSTNFIELRAPDTTVTSYDLIYPAALPASPAGKALTIQSVDASNNATLTWSDPGSAASASTVAIGNTVTAGTYYIPYTSATSGNGALNVDTSTLTYNPDTNTLTTSKVALNGSTSGTTTIQASAAAGTTTITLPATTGTVVTTGDSGTVTSAMIADGTIVNGDISSTAAIAVSKLSASTISGVTLGNNLNALTISTGLSGTSYNGSGAVTIAIDSTVATLTGLQNLTNKTLGSGSIWNGNLIGLQYGGTNKNFASPPAAGSLVYFDADSMEALAPGAAGTVLYIPKGGTPTWTSTGLLDVGTAAEAGSAAAINNITDTTTANITYYPLFAANTIFSQTLRIDSSTLTYNPSTNTLTTGNLTASSAVSADTLSTTGNGTIGGNLTVTGNLTVNGTTTTLNTETLAVEDNIVVLNSNVTASPSLNAGLEVERGTSPNTSFLWNETTDRWSVNHTDTTQSAYEYPITISDSSSAIHGGPAEGSYSTTGDFVGQGSISGTTLSITTVSSGAIRIGQIITGTGITSGTKITAWSSGSATGGTSSWTVNNSQTVSSTTITGSAGAAGPQYIHSAYIKYLDVKNLNMSGSWILGATIASNFDLQNGGLLLPYVGGSYHTTNALSGLPEGQIAYNTNTNRIVFNQGGTAGVDNSGTSQVSVISTGNLSDITSVGTLNQVLNANAGIAVDTDKFTVADATGNTLIAGTLGVTGLTTLSGGLTLSGTTIAATELFQITNGSVLKFFVDSATGNTNTTGTLDVGGITTIDGVLRANGGISVDTDKFTVADATGNTLIAGTLTVSSTTTLNGVLNANAGIAVDSDKFTVADATGNTLIAGTLGVTGLSTLTGGATLGAALAINYANPSITTNQTSGTIALLSTGFAGTANVLNVAQTINIGTSQTTSGAINIGSANTTLTSNGALTVTGTLTANGNITLGSDATDTIAVNGVITTNLVFEGSTADNFETTLAASNPAADITITMPAWGGTMVVPTGTATSTYLITSSGTSTQPSWTDPDNVVVGGVFVRRETTQDTTKYPIPFLGSSKENNPATTWGLLVPDGASQAAYLYTDMTNSGGSVGGGVTNSSSGLMYEVGNGVGTLYADYIGATLDCGTY
jgi:hypothetical protein